MATFAAIAFLVALVLIATEWMHRAVIVMVGGALFIVAGVLDQHDAFEALDLNTLGLLIGMMVIVVVTEKTGVFEFLAIKAVQLARGSTILVVFSLTLMTAVLSAFLDNLTSILIVAPIVILVAVKLSMPVVPLLVLQILASNIGGTATLIGDPPNIMIAGATGLSFSAFIKNLAPVAAFTLVVTTVLLYWVNRRRFRVDEEAAKHVTDLQPDMQLATGWELWAPVGVLLATVIAFFFHGALHLEPATVALSGAAAMLLVARCDVDETLREIDWPTLFFFAGLFVMVGGLEEVGVIDAVASKTREITAGSRPAELIGTMWIAAIGSAFVDNIPFTAAMIPVVESLNEADDDSYWWALALGACFGGNATIIAAAANVACQGIASRAGHPISFTEFLRWGIPTTVLSLLIATAYIYLFHL